VEDTIKEVKGSEIFGFGGGDTVVIQRERNESEDG